MLNRNRGDPVITAIGISNFEMGFSDYSIRCVEKSSDNNLASEVPNPATSRFGSQALNDLESRC
jgi:hypothetical protein